MGRSGKKVVLIVAVFYFADRRASFKAAEATKLLLLTFWSDAASSISFSSCSV